MRKRILTLLLSGALVLSGLSPVCAEEPFSSEGTEDFVEISDTQESSSDEILTGGEFLEEEAAEDFLAEDADEEILFEGSGDDILSEDGSVSLEPEDEIIESVLPEGETAVPEDDAVLTEELQDAVPVEELTEETAGDPTEEEAAGETEDELVSEEDPESAALAFLRETADALTAFTADSEQIDGDIPMVGVTQETRDASSEKLKNYIKGNGDVDESGANYIVWHKIIDGKEVMWEISYSESTDSFTFGQYSYDTTKTMLVHTYVVLPYARKGSVTAICTIENIKTSAVYMNAIFTMSNPAGYKGSEQLPVTFTRLVLGEGETREQVSYQSNLVLQSAFKQWNDYLLIYPHLALTSLGFDSYGFTHTHNYVENIIQQAGVGTEGLVEVYCLSCGDIKSSKKISAVSYFGLNATELQYNGAPQRPLAMVRDSDGALINTKYYDVTYDTPSSKNVGTYSMTVKLKGWYYGSRTLKYRIVSPSSVSGLVQPKLIAAYNGVKGIGICFYKVTGATHYVIYRKYKGVWSPIRTIAADSTELQVNGNRLMYTDTSVKNNYGEGYIYSVAAKKGSKTTAYNAKGSAIYRLTPPQLPGGKKLEDGVAFIVWNMVNCHGFEVQYYETGLGSQNWIKCEKTSTLNQTIKGLKKGKGYGFRIRCYKTNADRGTYYSEYTKTFYIKV